MNRTGRRTTVLILVGLILGGALPGPLAGELEPPGAPGPTMKPLPELEPRTPIHAVQLPLTIIEPGSYYLAENIVTDGGGITIDADNVSLDLMGFTLEGGTGNGITVLALREGARIRNGTVKGWGQHGIDAAYRTVIVDVFAWNNMGNGIQVGPSSKVIDCEANYNHGHGITVEGPSLVRGCLANWNWINGLVVDGSLVIDSEASLNYKHGIRVDNGCHVVGCKFIYNDQNRVFGGAGVWILGDGNRIERNHLYSNDVGLDVDGSDNVVIQNTIWQSRSFNFDIDPGATGNMIETSTDPTTAGPWSNLVR